MNWEGTITDTFTYERFSHQDVEYVREWMLEQVEELFGLSDDPAEQKSAEHLRRELSGWGAYDVCFQFTTFTGTSFQIFPAEDDES